MAQHGEQAELAIEGVGGLDCLLDVQPCQPDLFDGYLAPALQIVCAID
jgi:hypothetical protein